MKTLLLCLFTFFLHLSNANGMDPNLANTKFSSCASISYTHTGGISYVVPGASPILMGGQSIKVIIYINDCDPIEITNTSTNNGNIPKGILVGYVNTCNPQVEYVSHFVKVQVIFTDRFGSGDCFQFDEFYISI